ncbi:MAG: LamG-like jellyroll fold domain-containing protein [Nocardioides sp.]|uniref:LamG-like jellyroll fold domain-containing protein n=1 Tax=Nocardioides sp. TaxID=35761 RepID=UPI003D6A0B7A
MTPKSPRPAAARPRPALRSLPLSIITALALVTTMVAAFGSRAEADDASQPAGLSMTTPWTDDVSPDNALPEYPRPQLARTEWRSLNGTWEFSGAAADEQPPFGSALDEEVLVPYPIESALSGIGRHEDRMWYRRTFEAPKSWNIGSKSRLVLNFGAIDYDSTVYVNGVEVATHRGGFDKFSADVTDALRENGPQELVIGVTDLGDQTWQPLGKQRNVPDRGIFYEGASGIWQTVWMEPVSAQGHVQSLRTTPDIDTSTLALTVDAAAAEGATVEAVVKAGKKTVSVTRGAAASKLTVPVPKARLWSPDDPYLYKLQVTLKRGNRAVDTVGSYFGMREIGTKKGADGKLRITLNKKITFLMSTLDQGYWPDGIYTAPTDEALRWDISETKKLGFNTIRKHIKVEPDRWYYAADQLGMLVWQDMPSMKTGGTPPPEAQTEFKRQLETMVDQHDSWTSIIGWVPFNEGWGEWDRTETGEIADAVKAQDPSRLVNAHSGVNCCASLGDSGRGDVIDWHAYTGPAQNMPSEDRVAMDGEHGGYGLEVDDHMWFGEGHAYQMAATKEELTSLYVENQEAVLASAQRCGISSAVYTQTTDVEHEVNGFYTYDRQVKKMDFAQVRAVNRSIIDGADGSGTPPGEVDPGTPGLDGVHAYPFSEGSGTTTADSVGDADATLTDAEWVTGVEGNALSFAGTGAADTGETLIKTDGSYSVSAWVKLDEAGGAFQTAVSQDTGRDSAFFLQYSGADERWSMSFSGVRALSSEKPVPGQWYHLTGVRDAATGSLALYVDGQKQGEQQVCTAPATTGHTVIGRGQFGGNLVDYLGGDIDEVRVFDRALSPEEVAEVAGR